jgi:hypothetical protein
MRKPTTQEIVTWPTPQFKGVHTCVTGIHPEMIIKSRDTPTRGATAATGDDNGFNPQVLTIAHRLRAPRTELGTYGETRGRVDANGLLLPSNAAVIGEQTKQ